MDQSTRHLLALGRESFRAGNYDEALADLQLVNDEVDSFADVHHMLGVILNERGKGAEARLHLERALELNPRYTEAALHLSLIYNEMGRYGEAREVYLRAAGEAGSTAMALARFDRQVHSKVANLHADLGDAYVAIGQFDRAVQEFRRAVDVCPSYPDLRMKLGVAMRELGRIDDALVILEDLREMHPEYQPGRLNLGVTLWAAGRFEEARHEWKHVLERDPENRSALFYMRLLRER